MQDKSNKGLSKEAGFVLTSSINYCSQTTLEELYYILGSEYLALPLTTCLKLAEEKKLICDLLTSLERYL